MDFGNYIQNIVPGRLVGKPLEGINWIVSPGKGVELTSRTTPPLFMIPYPFRARPAVSGLPENPGKLP
jgi:hypothetical protein